jgi:hypothetical protein
LADRSTAVELYQSGEPFVTFRASNPNDEPRESATGNPQMSRQLDILAL